MSEKTAEQKQLAQGAISACLACAIDAIDKAAEVTDKLGNQKNCATTLAAPERKSQVLRRLSKRSLMPEQRAIL